MKKIVSPGLRVERCLLASDPPVDRNLLHPWAKQQKSPRPWPWKIKVGCSKHRGLGYAKLPFPRENADQTVILECLILRQAWELWLPQLCAVTFSPAPAKRFRNQKLAQRHWKHVWLSWILCLFPFYLFFYTSQPVKASTEFLVLSVGCTHVVPCYLIK